MTIKPTNSQFVAIFCALTTAAASALEMSGCQELGAERGINYKTEDFVDVIRKATNGRGVDVILDMIGGDYGPRKLKALADDGRLIFINSMGGAEAKVTVSDIMRRRLTITGSTLRSRPVAFKGSVADETWHQVWPMIKAGKIQAGSVQNAPTKQRRRTGSWNPARILDGIYCRRYSILQLRQ